MSNSPGLGTEIVEQFHSQGSNLGTSHKLDFYFYFPTEQSAQKFAEELASQGFTMVVRQAAQGIDWLCLASRQMIPDERVLNDLGRWFQTLVAVLDGEFDGWESDVIPQGRFQ